MRWAKRLACRTWGHVPVLRRLYSIECARCGFVIAEDPRDSGWHHTDIRYVCGAATPSGPCHAESPTPDGSCARHC